MTDNRTERVNRVRAAKNNLILDGAQKVFCEKGFYNCRLEDIAIEAGFSKASLYNYYKDKEEIFLSLAIREHRALNRKLRDDEQYRIDFDSPFTESLTKLFNATLSAFIDHFSVIVTLDSEYFIRILDLAKKGNASKGSVEYQFALLRDEIDSLIIKLIQISKERGEIQSPLSSISLAEIIDSLVHGVLKRWHLSNTVGDITSTIDELIMFISKGFEIKDK